MGRASEHGTGLPKAMVCAINKRIDRKSKQRDIRIKICTNTPGQNEGWEQGEIRVYQASPQTPSSHSSLETHPTALQLGQDTST
jgi:hypothetical protein